MSECVCLVQELPCGHFMHSHCFAQYTRYNYTCPVCAKSLGDMTVYFRMIDSLVRHDLSALPAAYSSRIQVSPSPWPLLATLNVPAQHCCACLDTLYCRFMLASFYASMTDA